MLTLANVKEGQAAEIYFDMDDSGLYYIKQDNDWIILDEQQLSALSRALLDQLARL
jgi:hypothetical protein